MFQSSDFVLQPYFHRSALAAAQPDFHLNFVHIAHPKDGAREQVAAVLSLHLLEVLLVLWIYHYFITTVITMCICGYLHYVSDCPR